VVTVEPGDPQRPALVDRWADLDLTLYADLVAAPSKGLPLATLARRYDAEQFTTVLDVWGQRPVLQLEDTSAEERVTGAVGGWFLGEGATPIDEPTPVSPDELRYGPTSEALVTSVLLREWADAPSAEDPFDLLLAEIAVLPAPWSVCRPRTEEQAAAEEPKDADVASMPHAADPTLLYAVDEVRGLAVGLVAVAPGGAVPSSGGGPFAWTVDHLEISPTARSTSSWWTALGYADCVEVGKVLGEDRARRPRAPFGPPA